MSLQVRQFNLPEEITFKVSEYLSNKDYVAFKSSCREIYFALNESKREVLSRKSTMQLCIRANLRTDGSISENLYRKPLNSLTLSELELLDETVKRIVANNFASLKNQPGGNWKNAELISNLVFHLGSLGEEKILEALLKADTKHEISHPSIGNAFYKAASLGHQRVVTLLLSNPSGHTFRTFFLERGLLFSSLKNHSDVVREILGHERMAEIRDSAFTQAFSHSTLMHREISSSSEGFINSFDHFLTLDRMKVVGVQSLYDSISNLVKLKHHESANALLGSKRIKSRTFSAILSRAIKSKNLEVFKCLIFSPEDSLLTFAGFKKALSVCCQESAKDPYFLLAQHRYFKSLSKNDLRVLLNIFQRLSVENEKSNDTVAICNSLSETFLKKVEN